MEVFRRRSSEVFEVCLDALIPRRNSSGGKLNIGTIISPPNTPVKNSPQNSTSEDTAEGRSFLHRSFELTEDNLKSRPPQIFLKKVLHTMTGHPSLGVSRPEIDGGFQIAVNWISEAIKRSAQRVLYAKLLVNTVLCETDNDSIHAVERLPDSEKKNLIEGSITVHFSPVQSIEMNTLRFAALSKRFVLLRYLLKMAKEKKFAATTEDPNGWNLAHYIALHSKSQFPTKDFPELTDMLEIPNRSGATALDFVYWLSEPSPASVAALGKDKIPPFQLKEWIGHFYWNRPCFSPGALLRCNYNSPNVDPPTFLSPLLDPLITEYINGLENPSCKLYIKKRKRKLKNHWKCAASKDLKKGEIIALYSGTIFHNLWKDPNVKQGDLAFPIDVDFIIDPNQGGGSLAEFINLGFPNCAGFEYLHKGLPLLVIIALEDMKADTVLYMPQGRNYSNPNKHIELNKKGRKKFLNLTKKLQQIPPYDFSQDGKFCYSVENGNKFSRQVQHPPDITEAVDTWANKIRMDYFLKYEKKLATKINLDFLMSESNI